jgi:hypothetical protein
MKFPGGRLLHTWELARHHVSFDDLLRSCHGVNLTGFVELMLPSGAGMLLCYLGSVVSLIYREGPVGYHGPEAADMVRAAMAREGEGSILVYELPLEMAHLLRGVTKRHRTECALHTPAELQTLLEGMKRRNHTGLVEVQARGGAAALLFVSGRLSNIYWDSGEGRTLEQGPALVGLQQALDGEEAPTFISTFSQEVWRSRSEAETVASPAPHEKTGGDPQGARAALLASLDQQIPSMSEAAVFDLLTGAILARRLRGAVAFGSALLTEKIPGLALYCRALIASTRDDEVELLELSTSGLLMVVAAVARAQEGIAVVADRSQPTSHVSAIVARAAAEYGQPRYGVGGASAAVADGSEARA